MSESRYDIIKDDQASRFLILVDGKEAGYVAFTDDNGVRDFHHTEIYDEYRGQGLTNSLLKIALTHTVTDDLKIRPTCSAVQHFLTKEGNAHLNAYVV